MEIMFIYIEYIVLIILSIIAYCQSYLFYETKKLSYFFKTLGVLIGILFYYYFINSSAFNLEENYTIIIWATLFTIFFIVFLLLSSRKNKTSSHAFLSFFLTIIFITSFSLFIDKLKRAESNKQRNITEFNSEDIKKTT